MAPIKKCQLLILFLCGLLTPHTSCLAGQTPTSVQSLQIDHTNPLLFRDAYGKIRAAKSIPDWEQRRRTIIAAMQEVMGPLPGPEKRTPVSMTVDEEVDCESYVRRLIHYTSEPGGDVPAYLLIPKEALASTNRFPGVLCLHQTHALGKRVVVGLGNSANDEYGVDLVKRGFVCLAPAYPLLVDYQPDLKALGYQSGTMKAVWDNMRGLDLLESLPFVKRGAFGAIGHSLGGHNAIFTAVFDQRIQVIVSSCGFDSFKDYKGGDIKGWTSERYMPRLLNYSLDTIPFDFYELIAALAPRHCFVNAPFYDHNFKWRSVYQIEQAAAGVYDLYHLRDRLRIEYPKCGHEFPIGTREAAYRILEDVLQNKKP